MTNNTHLLDFDTYLEIIELAKQNGKKPGDSMKEEFEEIRKINPNKIKFLGTTENNVDLLSGNLREEGFKVLKN